MLVYVVHSIGLIDLPSADLHYPGLILLRKDLGGSI
jgi:hypothetical protein